MARVGVDMAGGLILGGGQGFVRVGGALWAVLGDAVAPHGEGAHGAPVMAEGSSFVRINGIPVCMEGNQASCGHAATGAAWARVSN
jgi:uncharacterized Zn-binding protein involved in type VI secretion